MYALILPALTPFVLLATVMGLSWLEDHVLPPAAAAQDVADTASLVVAVTAAADPRQPDGAVDRAGTTVVD